MKVNYQQLEREVFELIGKGFSTDPMINIYALEAACLILDSKFGIDFHKKNPKLAIRFAESIMKNIRIKEFNDIGEYADSIPGALHPNNLKSKETLFEDYADSFRF